ncbi:MAG: hypothetical protein V4538_15690 [Bacteroidota bacterium]
MKNREVPREIELFAIKHITSRPEDHASYYACSVWIRKKRKKFANEIMDLFEHIKDKTDNFKQPTP